MKQLFLCVSAVMAVVFLYACAFDSGSTSPIDNDGDSEQNPADIDPDEPDTPADLPELAEPDREADPEPELTEPETPADQPDVSEPEPELEPEPEPEPELEPEEPELVEPEPDEPELEPEPDPEPEPEPEPQCTKETAPATQWSNEGEYFFRRHQVYDQGSITGPCQTKGYLFAGGKGMQVQVGLRDTAPFLGRLTVTDIASATGRRAGQVFFDQQCTTTPCTLTTQFTLPYAGEYLVAISGADYTAKGSFVVSGQCVDGCDTQFTRFPIVLMHGMAGWDTILNFYEYFQGVEENLRDLGFLVETTQVAMFNDSYYRAQEVERQLVDILNDTGARKLDLVVHSQGGIDARHFISVQGHGGEVAVLAMVATPNRGTIIADMILGNVPGVGQDVIGAVIDSLASFINGDESDIIASLGQVSVDKMENEFNPAHPDDPRVRYLSWAGLTCPILDGDCRAAHSDEWLNPYFALIYPLIYDDGNTAVGYGVSDGLVPLNSAQWGEFQWTVDADHIDEIGQLKTGDFDHKAFYRRIVEKLVAEEY